MKINYLGTCLVFKQFANNGSSVVHWVTLPTLMLLVVSKLIFNRPELLLSDDVWRRKWLKKKKIIEKSTEPDRIGPFIIRRVLQGIFPSKGQFIDDLFDLHVNACKGRKNKDRSERKNAYMGG